MTDSPAQRIAERVKETLRGLDPGTMRSFLARHYREWRLIDAAGNWFCPEIAARGERLLPPGLTCAEVAGFVDTMAFHAAANPYLTRFLARAEMTDFPRLSERFRAEGGRVLPDVVAYALALERLTEALVDDWRILEICLHRWEGAWKWVWGNPDLRLFEHVKLASLEFVIRRFVELHRTGVIPETFGRYSLPLNILEAVFCEVRLGFPANAKAGLTLAKIRPGETPADPATGAGPSGWSPDRKTLHLHLADSRQWADLYATWNMAFVSHFNTWPYVLVKLLIPQVNAYAAEPEAYMYKRCLAIHALVSFAFIGNDDPERGRINALTWRDDRLSRLWGAVNRQCARDFAAEIQRRKSAGAGRRGEVHTDV